MEKLININILKVKKYCHLIKIEQKKHVEAFEVLQPNTRKSTIKDVITENTLSKEAKNEFNKIEEIKKNGRQIKFSLQSK